MVRLLVAALPCFSGRSGFKHGGAGRDRTGDLLNANQALSQLSYSPLNPFLASRSSFPVGRNTPNEKPETKKPETIFSYRGRLDAAGRRQAEPAKQIAELLSGDPERIGLERLLLT